MHRGREQDEEMLHGLQIVMGAKELAARIDDRIRVHEESVRAGQLALIRDHLVQGESYTLGLADLCVLDLVPGEATKDGTNVIDGLKLRMTGVELRDLLTDAAKARLRLADHWKREAARGPAETPKNGKSPLPGRICEKEAERQEWRAEMLNFLKDHVDASATYWLGREDLEFGDLVPEEPDWLEEDELFDENVVAT
jgi:hypothetical protein